MEGQVEEATSQAGLRRPDQAIAVSGVFSIWEGFGDCVRERAGAALLRFAEAHAQDMARYDKESCDRRRKFKEEVRKGASVGLRLMKEKIQQVWAGEDDVSNVAQLTAQAARWEASWATDQPWDRVSGAATAVGIRISDRVSPSQIRNAARTFHRRTTAVEGWHP